MDMVFFPSSFNIFIYNRLSIRRILNMTRSFDGGPAYNKHKARIQVNLDPSHTMTGELQSPIRPVEGNPGRMLIGRWTVACIEAIGTHSKSRLFRRASWVSTISLRLYVTNHGNTSMRTKPLPFGLVADALEN